MTGPDHYREAERLIQNTQAELERGVKEQNSAVIEEALRVGSAAARMAQVHATLALAAATASSSEGLLPGNDDLDWKKVLSP